VLRLHFSELIPTFGVSNNILKYTHTRTHQKMQIMSMTINYYLENCTHCMLSNQMTSPISSVSEVTQYSSALSRMFKSILLPGNTVIWVVFCHLAAYIHSCGQRGGSSISHRRNANYWNHTSSIVYESEKINIPKISLTSHDASCDLLLQTTISTTSKLLNRTQHMCINIWWLVLTP
jgi:hypothetical protein